MTSLVKTKIQNAAVAESVADAVVADALKKATPVGKAPSRAWPRVKLPKRAKALFRKPHLSIPPTQKSVEQLKKKQMVKQTLFRPRNQSVAVAAAQENSL